MAEIQAQTEEEKENISLARVMGKWLEHISKRVVLNSLSPKTEESYFYAAKNIIFFIGDKEIEKLQAADLEKLVDSLVEKGANPNYVKYHFKILKMISNFAAKKGIINREGVKEIEKDVVMPRVRKKVLIEIFEDEEIENIRTRCRGKSNTLAQIVF